MGLRKEGGSCALNKGLIMSILYKRSEAGSLQIWSIYAEDDTIYTEWGVEHGLMQEQSEVVEEGKAGRSLDEQVQSRIDSKINKKLDKGYVRSRLTAMTTKATNRMGYDRPMLAKPMKNAARHVPRFRGQYLQHKYDGHRCLIHRAGPDEYVAYSRNGKPIKAITEILEQVKKIDMPIGLTLDGELYAHGVPLQRISSWVKRRQPSTAELKYIAFDLFYPDELNLPFSDRMRILANLPFVSQKFDKLNIAVTWLLKNADDLPKYLQASLNGGYEGLIMRNGAGVYAPGKRSQNVVKIKVTNDDEFPVEDVISSKDGYGILVLRTKSGHRFTATAPGNLSEKAEVLRNKAEYIGREVRVKYANLTEDGVPFHPVADTWRDKKGE